MVGCSASFQAILQFLHEKELIETLVALEGETGLKYVDARRSARGPGRDTVAGPCGTLKG